MSVLERFGGLAELARSSRLRRRPEVRVIGERWTDAVGVPHRLLFLPGSGELALQRADFNDCLTIVDEVDLPMVVYRGPVCVVVKSRLLVARSEWRAWGRRRELCRGELRGWRRAMVDEGSLQWLAVRLARL